MVEKSFLVQKFAKLSFGQYSVIGYSVAGEETVVQVPELDVCFDIGRAPYFALTSNILCISHAHMDHLAGLPYYLSQRYFQGMKPGIVLIPQELERPIEQLLRCWRDVERQGTPYKLVPMSPGDTYEVRRDFIIRAHATHHGGPSLGYALVSVREKLKPEYLPLPGPQIAELRRQGTEVQYRVEVPLVTYLGDTSIGPIFENPDVINAEILITETTFYEASHKQKAKVGRHLHLDQFAQILPTLQNKQIVLIHVSRRTGVRKARHHLRKRLPREELERIHFLMDFDGAHDGGDIDQHAPSADDASETRE